MIFLLTGSGSRFKNQYSKHWWRRIHTYNKVPNTLWIFLLLTVRSHAYVAKYSHSFQGYYVYFFQELLKIPNSGSNTLAHVTMILAVIIIIINMNLNISCPFRSVPTHIHCMDNLYHHVFLFMLFTNAGLDRPITKINLS